MGSAVLRTACPLDCPDTCSLAVTVDDGRIVRVDAAPADDPTANPLTDGWICAKVRRHADRVYAPERILTPSVRTGPKGSGEMRPASWDEAMAVAASAIRRAIDHHGPASVVPYLYNSSSGVIAASGLTERLFQMIGASKVEHTICAATNGAAWDSVYGDMLSADPADVEHAALVVIWGANPTVSNTHFPPLVQRAAAKGAKVVVIDPRRTAMATRADVHLAVRPGTDAVLALAMMREIARTGLVDHDFCARHATGTDELLAAADEWPLDRAAGVCGLDASAIAAFAHDYATTRPSFLRLGWGPERNRNGGAACRSILSLPVLCGHFGELGAGVMGSLSDASPLSLPTAGEPDGGWPSRRTLNQNHLGRDLCDDSLDPPIAVLVVQGANPVVMNPNQGAVIEGLERDDLVTIVHEQVFTDTCRYADVVLPATTHFEAFDVAASYGSFTVQPVVPVIDRVGDSRTNDELAAALAGALGLPTELFDPDTWWVGIDADRQGLGPRVVRAPGSTIQMVDTAPSRGTFSLSDASLPDRVPVHRELDDPRPLVLISPATPIAVNSMFGERHLAPPVLSLHPSDAAERGLASGDQVVVESASGTLSVGLRVDATLRAGVAHLPKGCWLHGASRGVNVLMPDHLDPLVGGACFNDARVEVRRVENGG